jgi:hypothetical protein
LAIVGQEFERRPRAVTKDVDCAAERILPQRLVTQRGEPIDTFAAIDGSQGEKDAALGGELEH